jgi:hypothetical protein
MINRFERTEFFMSLYLKEVEATPDIKRYICYLRAEAVMIEATGSRHYKKYETFKASMSRRQRVRREAARK